MWQKIFYGTKVNLKIISRNKGTWIISALYMLYISYYFVIYYKYSPVQQIIIDVSNLSVGCIIFFMFLGYYLGKIERDSYCDEIFATLKNGNILRFISKIMCGTIMISIFSVFIILGLFICYFMKDVDNILYYQTLIYIFRYYLLTITIFFTIGVIVGEKVRSKFAYILIFFIWLVFTPINHYLFMALDVFVNKQIVSIGYILNIFAPTPMYTKFNGIYGLPIQGYNLGKVILAMILLVFVINISYIRKYKKQFLVVNLILILFTIPTFLYMYKSFGKLWVQSSYLGGEFRRDIDYYLNKENIAENETTFSKYKIEKCNIELKIASNFRFSVDLDAKLEDNSDILTFALYHGFKVENIKDRNGKNLSFNQHGDKVNVILDRDYTKDEKISLNFEYDGYTTSGFNIEKEAVYLPPYFPYIPSNILVQAMNMYNYFGYSWNELNYVSNYTVKVEADNIVYSNLNEISKNCFEGNGANGVLLISGDSLRRETYKDIIYYGSAIEKKENFEKSIDEYFKAVEKVNRVFKLDISKNVEKIFFADLQTWNFPSVNKTYGSTVVFQVDNGYPIPAESIFLKDILKERLYKHSPSLEHLFIELLFIDATDDLIYDKNKLESNAQRTTINKEENKDDKMYRNIIVYGSNRIQKFYDSANEEAKIEFLRKFYNLINTNKQVDMKMLDDFLSQALS